MEHYNFFKGLNFKIDAEIQNLHCREKKEKSVREPLKLQQQQSIRKVPKDDKKKSLLSRLIFLKENSIQTKNVILKEINISGLKKNVLFQIMKEIMFEYLKRNHCHCLENIVANLNENEITTKTLKEKIILFGELLSVPVVNTKKKIKFQNQIRTSIIPYYNLREKLNLDKLYEQNNLIFFTFVNTVLFENQFFLYSILKSIKILFPETIPTKYHCLTFENIYQLLASKKYSSVTNFLTQTFPKIFFIIREIGFSSKDNPKFFRYVFINKPVQKSDTKSSLLHLLADDSIKKIFIEKLSMTNPLFTSFKLLAHAKNVTHIFLDANEEFCIK